MTHLFYAPDAATCDELPEEEAIHCLRVLRLKPGDEIGLTDGRGGFYRANITALGGHRCRFSVTERTEQPPLWSGRLHVAVAPTKNMDRMEWLAEKATEIGIDELTFLCCRFSERRTVKTERIERIVVAAMKQSLKARKPVVSGMTDFDEFIAQQAETEQKFIAHCGEGTRVHLAEAVHPGEEAVVLIGPEGDFSPQEVELALSQGFRPVSLGPSRLRTETAALAACHILNLANQPKQQKP